MTAPAPQSQQISAPATNGREQLIAAVLRDKIRIRLITDPEGDEIISAHIAEENVEEVAKAIAEALPASGDVRAAVIEDLISTFEQMRGYPEGDSNDPCFDLCGMPCCDELGCLHQKTREARAALSQSPATDAAARRDEIARIIDEHSFDTVKMHGRQNASQQSVRRLDDALAKADLILGGIA